MKAIDGYFLIRPEDLSWRPSKTVAEGISRLGLASEKLSVWAQPEPDIEPGLLLVASGGIQWLAGLADYGLLFGS
jgi:hypothetical protein